MAEDTQTGSVEGGIARDGKLSYIQIPAVDAAASAEFYRTVFGWEIRGTPEHVTFADTTGELIGAWMTDRAISSQPGILPYIYVDSVADTMVRVVAKGGSVVRQPYAEGGLTVATFRDVAGNVMGVWQA